MGAHFLIFQINKYTFSLYGHYKEKFSSFHFHAFFYFLRRSVIFVFQCTTRLFIGRKWFKAGKEGKTQPNNLLEIVSWQINPYLLAWVHSSVRRVVKLKSHVCKKLHK